MRSHAQLFFVGSMGLGLLMGCGSEEDSFDSVIPTDSNQADLSCAIRYPGRVIEKAVRACEEEWETVRSLTPDEVEKWANYTLRYDRAASGKLIGNPPEHVTYRPGGCAASYGAASAYNTCKQELAATRCKMSTAPRRYANASEGSNMLEDQDAISDIRRVPETDVYTRLDFKGRQELDTKRRVRSRKSQKLDYEKSGRSNPEKHIWFDCSES